MSKPSLGRGLGDLIARRPSTKPDQPGPKVDGGLRILIDGAPKPNETAATNEVPQVAAAVNQAPSAPATPEPAAPTPGPASLPAPVVPLPKEEITFLARALALAALFGADVALLAWTIHFVAQPREHFGWGSIAGCIFSISLAALCGSAAVLVASGKK